MGSKPVFYPFILILLLFIHRIQMSPLSLGNDGKIQRKFSNIKYISDGVYSYDVTAMTRFLDFDFGFTTTCICNCSATAGSVDSNREERKKRSVQSTRPVFTSAVSVVQKLRTQPEKLSRFLGQLIDNLSSENTIICECCNDWNVEGGDFDNVEVEQNNK